MLIIYVILLRESDFQAHGGGNMDEVRSRGQLRTGFNRSEMLKVQKEIERIKKSSSSVAEHKKAVSRAVESQRKREGEIIGYAFFSGPPCSDDGGHDGIDNSEFPCNSMKL